MKPRARGRRPAHADMAFGRLERTTGPQPMSDINMTPLIDVMLVLLVIFMITAPLMTSSLKLDLPKPTRPSPTTRRSSISVALDRTGAPSSATRRSSPPPSPSASPRRRSAIRRPRCSCAPTRTSPTAASPS